MSHPDEAFPVIETPRLRLRVFTPADLEAFAAIVAKPSVMRHLGQTGAPVSGAETEKIIDSIIAHWRRHGIGRWAVVHKGDGRLIGYGGLRWFEYEGEGAGKPELVYLLDEPYWGAGLATEVARAALDYGFSVKGYAEVTAMAKPENAASRHILGVKLGMRYAGEKCFWGIPVVQYNLARAEYLSARGVEGVNRGGPVRNPQTPRAR